MRYPVTRGSFGRPTRRGRTWRWRARSACTSGATCRSKRARHARATATSSHGARAMSPLSVATFLPQGSLTFDLVVFDEASQVKPVDALGAILRARQVVVVGDSKQLPPTSFFDAMLSVEETEVEETVTNDIESILGL